MYIKYNKLDIHQVPNNEGYLGLTNNAKKAVKHKAKYKKSYFENKLVFRLVKPY